MTIPAKEPLPAFWKMFQTPPAEYGEVSFFWWHGDPITREKLTWILNQLADKHICGLQINYCHSDHGGQQYGLTMESDPRPFSDAWWELIEWFVPECKKREMSVSLSDYTLGAPGQGSFMDAVLAKHPEFIGQRLVCKNGAVEIEKVPYSANPMCKGIGDAIAEEFYGAFERHLPGECGTGINFFFSDELNFNISGNLWSDEFAAEFLARKGYDIVPKRLAIFEDIGPETPKIRLDYYDVIVQLSEEGYFQPIYNWHQQRGMTFGCDHGGRGQDVTEFGDYFRTMKWNQGPGNDQPHLESNLIKSKVSASIAHLYQRPRVWLEGFYSSGWGTSCADVADATFRNFALGHNLLSLHGLYYSTHGSMWEWAPPCNHHHMPYWQQMGTLLECTQRLSWLLAQGAHRCDVAIVYPVAAMEADKTQGQQSVATAFDAARTLYAEGIDFDFIDFESIVRAQIEDAQLCVSQECYKAVVIPDMRAVRFSMLEKLAQFAQKGGCVVVLGQPPVESDRTGREDALVARCVAEITRRCAPLQNAQQLVACLDEHFVRDFETEATQPFFHHRKIEGNDLYYLYRIPAGTPCTLRASGTPVLLNPWTAEWMPLACTALPDGRMRFVMPLEATEVALVWFGEVPPALALPGAPAVCADAKIKTISLTGDWQCTLVPTMDNAYGDYELPAGNYFVGAQGRAVRYNTTDAPGAAPTLDDSGWEEGVNTYGTYFWLSDKVVEEDACIQMEKPTADFSPYRFSMRHGVWKDAGYQGSYHGLKGRVSDDFLVMGEKKVTHGGSASEYCGDGTYYFFTYLHNPQAGCVQLLTGEKKPQGIWLDGTPVTENTLRLDEGTHRLLLKYVGGGRTHFVVRRADAPAFTPEIPLAMRWLGDPALLPFDAMPWQNGKACWLRLVSPPGMQSLDLPFEGQAEVYADGIAMQKADADSAKGVQRYIAQQKLDRPCTVAIRFLQTGGRYGSAALQGPIRFGCAQGICDPSRPAEENGLAFYSGGIRYSKMIEYHPRERVCLELGDIQGSAEVRVNGALVSTMVAPPYRCELTNALQVGKNDLEILVCNTLKEHMQTIPTNFLQSTRPALPGKNVHPAAGEK